MEKSHPHTQGAVWGSIPESRFDKSLTALGVPRSKFTSIHAKCSRAALDMHEFMLQCYYQIRGRSAEKLQVDKAMLTSTPLGGIARLSPCHVISRGMADGITTFVPYSLKVHCTASIPELHRDLMWQDGYWAGSFAAAPFGFQ